MSLFIFGLFLLGLNYVLKRSMNQMGEQLTQAEPPRRVTVEGSADRASPQPETPTRKSAGPTVENEPPPSTAKDENPHRYLEPEAMPPTTGEELKRTFSKRLGLEMNLPANAHFEMGSFDEGRMLQAHIFFNDDPTIALGLYGYRGKVTEDQIKDFVMQETKSTRDLWYDEPIFGDLKKRGFADERAFIMKVPEDDYTQYLVYGKGPSDTHFVFLVYGTGTNIDKKIDTLKGFYDSLKVRN